MKKLSLTKDGDQFCVLLGEDLQSGIVAFGRTEELAMTNFAIGFLRTMSELKPNELPEKSDEELGSTLISLISQISELQGKYEMVRNHLAERFTDSVPDLGGTGVKITFAKNIKWFVRDKSVQDYIDQLTGESIALARQAKGIFEKSKESQGENEPTIRISIPKLA